MFSIPNLYPKSTLLILLLLSCLYIYFNDLLNVHLSLNINIETDSNKGPENIFDELPISKMTGLPEKEFTVKDTVLLTAFSKNHFIEAVLVLIIFFENKVNF